MNAHKIKSFVIFAVVGFWPVCFFLAYMVYSLGATFLIEIDGPLFVLVPIAVILLAHYLFSIQETWKRRTWIIYAVWLAISLLVGFLVGFVISAAFGGVSQAVVEGVAGPVDRRYLQYGLLALVFAAVSHILILPWVFFVVFLLKKLNRRFHLWADHVAS